MSESILGLSAWQILRGSSGVTQPGVRLEIQTGVRISIRTPDRPQRLIRSNLIRNGFMQSL